MKKLIYLLAICPLLSFSQSYTIEYDVKLNSISRKGVLNKNSKKTSFYYETLKKEQSKDEQSFKDGILVKKVSLIDNKERKRVQIYQKDSLLNIDYIDDKELIYHELFPKMKWELKNETKEISNLICHKATTVFRGRKYTAWYSLDLPSSVGPWKFNNLPGAILQVYDDSYSFYWNAVRITKNESDKKMSINTELEKVSIQKFVEQNEAYKEERLNRVILNYSGRGTKVNKVKSNRGRELKFEWEED